MLDLAGRMSARCVGGMTSRLSSVKIISAIIEVKYKDLVCSVLYVTVNNACLQAPVQVGISDMLY